MNALERLCYHTRSHGFVKELITYDVDTEGLRPSRCQALFEHYLLEIDVVFNGAWIPDHPGESAYTDFLDDCAASDRTMKDRNERDYLNSRRM